MVLLSFVICAGQFTENEGILELTQSDFDLAKDQFENLLVEFYAPWCGHCRSIAPEYQKAAEMMKEQGLNVKLAKVNGDEQPSLRDQYNITGYPSFKFFFTSKGKILDYKDGRHAGDFVGYIRKKTTPPVYPVETLEDAISIVHHNRLIFFGFFKDPDSKASQIFSEFAFDNDMSIFISTLHPPIAQHFHVTADDAILVFKQYDEGKLQMEGDITYANIKKFMTTHRLPLVSEFLEENAEEIFSTDVKNYMVLFGNKQDGNFNQLYLDFTAAAQHFKGRVVFLYVNLDEEEHEKVLEFFGLSIADCPAVRFINMTSDDPIRYNPASPDLDTTTMQEFVSNVLLGKVQTFYKSEESPLETEEAVKVLVGSTFDQFLSSATHNVIVYFYVPWCGHCKKLSPIWKELGELYKDNDKITLAQMDSSLNEMESLKVVNFPSIRLFIHQSKQVIEFTGERSVEALAEFVESEGKVIKVPEENIPTQVPKDEL